MKNLREILHILTSTGLKKSKILDMNDANGEDSTNYSLLYDGITRGEYMHDDDAARALYSATPSDIRYSTLKSRFKDILLQAVLNMDIRRPKVSASLEAQHKCNKNLLCARLLIALGARSSGTALVKKTLSKAQQYDFTEIVFQCIRILHRHYSITGARKEFRNSGVLLRKALQILEAETTAEELAGNIIMEYAVSVAYKPQLQEMAEQSARQINSLRQQFDTYTLNQIYYRVKTISCQIAMDYNGALSVCDEFEQYYRSNPQFNSPAGQRENAVVRIVCLTYLRDYATCQRYEHDWMALFRPGRQKWFTFLEYYFLLSMHTANYTKAMEIFQMVIRNKRFEFAPPQRIERWKLFEAYLRYVFVNAQHEAPSQRTTAFGRSFSLYRFLNEVPIFSKDKGGFNVPVLIVHVLFLLEKGNYDHIIDRAEPLRQYSSRYLRKEEYYRTNCFLKMLRIMIDKDFDYEQTRSRTRQYEKKLNESQIEARYRLEVTEIIPFEELWQRVLHRLQHKAASMV